MEAAITEPLFCGYETKDATASQPKFEGFSP
jgi:hypothetical protein